MDNILRQPPRSTSNTLHSDREDHPIAFMLVNIPLWFMMLIFIAIPFSLVAAIMCIFVRMIALLCHSDDSQISNMSNMGDLLTFSLYLPELCLASIIDNNDFGHILDNFSLQVDSMTQ